MAFLDAFRTEIVVNQTGYIFDGSGGMRDQLEQTIMQELESKKYPLKVAIANVKSGGWLGTKEQCVVIEVDKNDRVVIANTTIGSYLYVKIYHLIKVPNDPKLMNIATTVTDIFAHQRIQAAYAAAVAASESAFDKLQLKRLNIGYRPMPNGVENEDSI